MPSEIPLMPGVAVVNASRQNIYVRGRTIQTPAGPIKIFIVAQDPTVGSSVSGDEYEIGWGWLKNLGKTALNVAEAAGVPGAKAIRSVAQATGILKGKTPAKAAGPALRAPAAKAAAALMAPARRQSIVKHLPKGAKIPKKFVEVIPVASAETGAGFIE